MGRPRIYCSDTHRVAAHKLRHPLGEVQLAEWGLGPRPSLLELLAEARVGDPFA